MKQSIIFLSVFLVLSLQSFSQKMYQLEFEAESVDTTLCDFVFPSPKSDADLQQLIDKYNLDKLVSEAETDIEKSLILMDWTSRRWKHNGSNRPKKSDALSILEEADQGESFRCVEYGIVLASVLNSSGIPARTLGLKTKDVETSKYDAGHVVSEAYLPQLNKWVFMDGQVNYIPYLDDTPLNAVEYQNAIINDSDRIELRNINGKLKKGSAKRNMKWVSKYLFYLDARFDNTKNNEYCNGKRKLMLVPLQEKNPTIFQIDYKIDDCIYTNSLKDFYKEPKVLRAKS